MSASSWNTPVIVASTVAPLANSVVTLSPTPRPVDSACFDVSYGRLISCDRSGVVKDSKLDPVAVQEADEERGKTCRTHSAGTRTRDRNLFSARKYLLGQVHCSRLVAQATVEAYYSLGNADRLSKGGIETSLSPVKTEPSQYGI